LKDEMAFSVILNPFSPIFFFLVSSVNGPRYDERLEMKSMK